MNGGKSPRQKGPRFEHARPRMSTFSRVHAGEILHQEARIACWQHLARSLWESGPRPVLEALLEVEAGRPLGAVLERYARIPAHIYRALGADALRPQIHRIKISNSVTIDGPDGRPWPPPDGTALWAIVRRADGCTHWRAIQLLKSDPLPRTFAIPVGSNRN